MKHPFLSIVPVLALSSVAATALRTHEPARAETAWEHGLVEVDLRGGELGAHAALVERGIRLAPSIPERASWTSAPFGFEGGFDELLPSWNVRVPAGCGFTVELSPDAARTRDEPAAPPAWLHVGSWGDVPGDHAKVVECEGGKIATDYFTAQRRFSSVRLRVTGFRDQEGDDELLVRRLTLCWSRREEVDRAAPRGGRKRFRAVDLDVPFHSQRSEAPDLASRICSPTSVAMVLAYRGVTLPPSEVARTLYDAEHDIYGNWPRAVQGAYVLGVPGYLRRFSDWRDVESALTQGQPLICSIAVKEGELRGAPYSKTAGHLIVVRGFDAEGGVLVNDPAASDADSGRLTYAREDLEKVWFGRGGTTYVLLPREDD